MIVMLALTSMLLVVQAAFVAHGHNVANTAARQAAQRAAALDTSVAEGEAYGQSFVAGSAVWSGTPLLTVTATDVETTATVVGEVVKFVPVPGPFIVEVSASSATERFVAGDE